MTTITIAGEALTDDDWPEGSPYFRFVSGSPYWQGVPIADLDKYPMERGICAAVARCWFLDKAAEIELHQKAWATPNEVFENDIKRSKYLRYLASAEKWARTGRKGL